MCDGADDGAVILVPEAIGEFEVSFLKFSSSQSEIFMENKVTFLIQKQLDIFQYTF